MYLLKEIRKKGGKIMLYNEAIKFSRLDGLSEEDYRVLEHIYLTNDFKDQPQFWDWFHMMCRMLSVEPVHFVIALRFCHDVIFAPVAACESQDMCSLFDPTDGFC
jgi:hypothetical protein